MKTVTMRQWVPEGVNTPLQNEILIKGIVQDLAGQEPGQYAVSVGGDTLIFAVIDDTGELNLYECSIRRATQNVADAEAPLDSVPTWVDSKAMPA